MLVAASVVGLGYGATFTLMNALLARVFGPVNFGPAMGLAGPMLVACQSVGAPMLGYVYDVRGDYGPGLWLLAAAMAIPAIAVLLVRIPDEPPRSAADLSSNSS